MQPPFLVPTVRKFCPATLFFLIKLFTPLLTLLCQLCSLYRTFFRWNTLFPPLHLMEIIDVAEESCGSKLWSQLCIVFKHSPPWMCHLLLSHCAHSWSRHLWCTSSERWSLPARGVSWCAAGLDAHRDSSRVALSEHEPGRGGSTQMGISKCHLSQLCQHPGPPPTLLLVLGNTHCKSHGKMWYAFHRAGVSVRSSSSKIFSCHHQDHHLLCF